MKLATQCALDTVMAPSQENVSAVFSESKAIKASNFPAAWQVMYGSESQGHEQVASVESSSIINNTVMMAVSIQTLN